MSITKREVGYSDGIMVYLFAIVGNIAAQLVAGIVVSVGVSTSGDPAFGSGGYFQLLCMALFQIVFLAVPVIYYGLVRKNKPVLLSPIKKPHPAHALSLLLPVVALVGFMLPALLFETLLVTHGYKPSSLEFTSTGELIVAAIVVGVLAPVVEELIFRGFLLSGLRRVFNPYAAAVMSAAAFSLMHMNPEQTVYQFCLGFVCALAVIKSGNLLTAIVTHALSNFLVLFADRPLELIFSAVTATAAGTVLATIGFFIVAAVAVYFICFGMQKLSGESGKPVSLQQPELVEEARKSKKVGVMLYGGGMGLCVVLWIFVFVSSMI